VWCWLGGVFGGGAAWGGATVKVVASVAAVAAAAPVGVGTLERELRRHDDVSAVAEAPVRTATARTPAPSATQSASTTSAGTPAPSVSLPAATTPASSIAERTPTAAWRDRAPKVEEVEERRPRSVSRARTPRRTAVQAPVTQPAEEQHPRVLVPRVAGHQRPARRAGGDDRLGDLDPTEQTAPTQTVPQDAPEPTGTTQEVSPPATTAPTTTTTVPVPAPELDPEQAPDGDGSTPAG
jgi:hypothetical protein